MANWQLNKLVKKAQFKTMVSVLIGVCVVLSFLIVLLVDAKPKRKASTKDNVDITGIVEESFTEKLNDNALTAQQSELDSLKKQLVSLTQNIKALGEEQQKQLQAQKEELSSQLNAFSMARDERAKEDASKKDLPSELKSQLTLAMNGSGLGQGFPVSDVGTKPMAPSRIHTVSFRPKPKTRNHSYNYLSPSHYVPSNTSVRAVVLGGADSDASVNGQSKNNGTMLFKFLEDGTLPNGQRSRLKGCRVSANSYGDISSERAFATLYRLSCAHPGQPIIDKRVNGWVFFNGKVGIKGQPLMRDNKVMTWAGISGALSGIAQAAQYAQSIQNIGPYGATSVVPSSQIAPFAAYGGASKAADTLSSYYIKRAEQYHPVIQVGSGNVVTVVFQEGFYLEPEEDRNHSHRRASTDAPNKNHPLIASNEEDEEEGMMNYSVPPEVLGRIDRVNAQSANNIGVR